MRMMRVWLVLSATAISAMATTTAFALNISGRLWEDVNRNGIRDDGEPPISGQAVLLSNYLDYEPAFQEAVATNVSDASGFYSFTGITNRVRAVLVFFNSKYRTSAANIGGDDTIDSDFCQTSTFCGYPYAIHPIADSSHDESHVDAGVYGLIPDMGVTVTINGADGDAPYHATNGACISIVYTVTNRGETALTWLFFLDSFDYEGRFLVECPYILPRQRSITFTNCFSAACSVTNLEDIVAFAVDSCSCSLHDSDPPWYSRQSVIVVVTNDPAEFADGDAIPNPWEIAHGLDPLNPCAMTDNTDCDWMTDYEEYLADTDPRDASSYLPPASLRGDKIVLPASSATRVYTVWSTTNLNDEPQAWTRDSAGMYGTDAALDIVITNAPACRMYRIGVEVP